jgi:phage shock protein C
MRERLYRSRRVRVFGGVAGGIAQYFNIDPIIIRILFIAFTILHGFGLLLYIILWIVVPEEPFELAYSFKPDEHANTEGTPDGTTSNTFGDTTVQTKKSSSGRMIAGILLIAIGIIFFADRFIPSFEFWDIMPIVILIVGALLIWNSLKK